MILIVAIIFYAADKLTSAADKNFWRFEEKLFIRISAFVPLFFGLIWFTTFGFTDYRAHLAFVGFPLSFLALTYGFLLARLTYLIVLLNCVAVFAASVFLVFVTISWFLVPAIIPAIIGFVYVFGLRKGLYRRFEKKLV